MQLQQDGFDNQMAKAELEASGMRTAYNKLACDNAEQKETAARVSYTTLGEPGSDFQLKGPDPSWTTPSNRMRPMQAV